MNKKGTMIFGLIIYKILYEFIYSYGVSPLFSYMQLIYKPNLQKMVLSYVLFFLLIVILPQKRENVSEYLISVFFIFTVTPLLSFYWQADQATTYILYCVIAFIVLVGASQIPIKTKTKNKIVLLNQWKMRKVDIVALVALVIGGLMILITMEYGFADSKAMNLYLVYEVRENRSFTGIYGYIINWIPYALVPWLLCMSLYLKRWGYVIFAVVVQVYMFLLLGSKTALFSVALILASYFLVKLKCNYMFMWSIGLTTLNIFTFAVWKVFSELMPFGIFPTRLLSLPAAISFMHYDFFSTNPKLHFAENIIGRILGIKSPYSKLAMYLISGVYGKTASYCTGYLGDSYDNGGFAIMIVYSIILALIFRLIDKIYKEVSNETRDQQAMFVGILTYSMIYLNDGTLTALLATGGLVLVLVLFIIYENKIYCERKIDTVKRIGNETSRL